MILLRWTCLALFVLGAVGCGSSDSSREPTPSARQEMISKIERLKAKAAQKPAR